MPPPPLPVPCSPWAAPMRQRGCRSRWQRALCPVDAQRRARRIQRRRTHGTRERIHRWRPWRRFDSFTDGARTRMVDPFTDGARIAGLDRAGVSSDPARSIDPYTDGARTRMIDPFTDGARIAGLDRAGVSSDPARGIDPYTDGARTRMIDPFTDGARIAGLDRAGARPILPAASTRTPMAPAPAWLIRSPTAPALPAWTAVAFRPDPARNIDPFTDGAQKLAGMDTRGVSASPARSFDPYQDGAHA
ncbi:hypothetical protein ACU4GD_08135 [Cupriavidus basilensis]